MLRCLCALTLTWPVLATAQISLLPADAARRSAPLIVQTRVQAPVLNGASLFAGRDTRGLLAPRVLPRPEPAPAPDTLARASRAPRLLDLIARAEAGSRGYDAVQYGARVQPPRAPTKMTVAEIYDWIDATPGQPHAIGRYQFIPKTLRALVDRLDIAETARFSPALQDRLADALLQDAGIARFLDGDLDRAAFMDNLARIWAGLPTASGKSHYHGYAGNKATITRAHFEAQMARIFPGAG